MRSISFMLLGHFIFAVIMWDFRQTPYWLAIYSVILAGWLTKRAPDGGGLARFLDKFYRPRR